MDRPLISVLHPTRRVIPNEQFPRGWRDAHDAWLARADHPENIEYVLCVHESRFAQIDNEPQYVKRAAQWQSTLRWRGFEIVCNTKRDCVVDQTNCAAEASSGKILIGTADDYYPPEHWDTLILEALPIAPGWMGPGSPRDLDGAYILHFSTGAGEERDRALMIGGAWTRPVYDLYGYILDPDFESMFADNWYAHCARRDYAAGKLQIIERLDIQFDHRHPIFGKGQMDESYAQQNAPEAYQRGYAILLRKMQGTRTLAVCLPGESFSFQVFAGHLHLVCALNQGPRFLVKPINFYSSNVSYTRMKITEGLNAEVVPWDFVLWVDDDNILTPEQFNLLLQDLEENPELAGVVGWCWCDPGTKQDLRPQDWMMSIGRQGPNLECWRMTYEDFQRAADSGRWLITSDDLAKDGHVFWSGFPVVLLRGETLRQLGPEAFAPVYHPDVKFKHLSEDASFFYNANKAGMKFACDVRVKVPHLKLAAIEPAYIPIAEREEARRSVGEIPLASAAD